MVVWRLTTKPDRDAAFDGKGALAYGGRWNRKGTRVVYTAETLALAVLEQLVHVLPAQMKNPFYYFEVEIPDDSIEVMSLAALPPDWNALPAPMALADIGSNWATSCRSLALRVPSAVLPKAGNVVLNREHPAWSRIKIGAPEQYWFDGRLLKT